MSARRHSSRAVLVATLLATVSMAACSRVPSSGPSRDAVVYASAQQTPPFLLTRLSDFTIQKLQRFPGPSLYGKFGDYRRAVEQRVGIGDTLTVTIFEAAGGGLFSQPVTDPTQTGSHSAALPAQIVQRDGAITVPYAGRIEVDGKTIHEIEREIVQRLTGKAIEPQVVVSLSRNIASSVTLNGESVQGSRVPLHAGGDRLLDVIAQAGGITTPANQTFIELTRDGKTVRVPFQTLLNDAKQNIYARPDDTLTVVKYPLTFTAVGATGSNAVITFDAVGISLAEAIGKSLGLTDGRADPEGVFIFRYEPADVVRDYPGLTPQQAALDLVPTVYVLNMRDPRSLFLARKFSMHDKDIVYVSNSPYVEITKVVGVINTFLGPALNAGSLAQSIKGTNSGNLNSLSNGLSTGLSAPAAQTGGSTSSSSGTTSGNAATTATSTQSVPGSIQ